MEISIVMTTYNGEKYIIEQMDSIYKQTMLAEEVLIFDDGSTDNTVDIISSYIKENNIANWKLFKNKDNLGWKKNFIAGFEKAGGQLIFPCDQDDIWELDKIEKMAKVMSDNHDINVLASNYNIFYENGVKGKKKTIMCNNNQVHRVNLNKKSIYNQRPGCVYAFRKSFFLTHKSLWIESMAHDEFLWKIALLTNTLYLYNFISIRYRRHLNAETLVRDSIEGRARRLRESSKFFTLSSMLSS